MATQDSAPHVASQHPPDAPQQSTSGEASLPVYLPQSSSTAAAFELQGSGVVKATAPAPPLEGNSNSSIQQQQPSAPQSQSLEAVQGNPQAEALVQQQAARSLADTPATPAGILGADAAVPAALDSLGGSHAPSAATPCDAAGGAQAVEAVAPAKAAPLVLSQSLHARECECGELSLKAEELQLLQPFLLQYSWRLVPCAMPARKGGSSKSSRSRVCPSRRIAQELEALQSACDTAAMELGKRRQKRASSRYDDLAEDRKTGRLRTGSPGDPSGASARSADASVVSQQNARTRSRASRTCAASQQQQHESGVCGGGVESRSSRRRRFLSGDDVQSLCSDSWGGAGGGGEGTGSNGGGGPSGAGGGSHLKSLKAAQWFLYPVDPEADNVPDYLDVVQHPMDLQTVEKKLLQGAYPHPFLWQQDVRQVFFNAFSYHVVSTEVWRDATALALEFERCCKHVHEVNPYAEVVSDSDELAASLQTTRPLEGL
ncbi:glycine, alanine and asparagine-rich protein, partial [Cyclospora cayetanensis]|uniref:Glycine, alanine and asparagine-rich protein n=1 Tax=Cyclospora cayetanensis TaxID=88456 RepID=A0A6P6RYF8_9EIME